MSEPAPAEEGLDEPAPLPRPVQARVAALAAQALPQLPADQVPGALRRFATFAPARRAQLAGGALAAALAADEDFRAAVAEQLRGTQPELAAAVENPAGAGPHRTVDLAAMAYLLRSPGWTELVESVRVPRATAAEEAAEGRGSRQLDRLRTELDAAVDELRRTKSRAKERLAQLRTENADLRRRVATLTQQAGSAEQALAAASQQLAAERELAGSASGQAQAEARRLRARIAELETESAAVRRAGREGRDAGSLRARLLLDALIDTAAGLRRELALPPVSGSPADTVTAGIPPGQRSAVQARGRAADDPDLLAERLALPGAHLVVDGYNVTKTAWPTATLETQRTRLLSGLAAVAARTGAEVTVVFDGADLDQPPALTPPRRVRVRFSPPGVIADDVIRILVAAEPPGRPVVVASSDREVAQGVEDNGATAVPAGALVNLLSRA